MTDQYEVQHEVLTSQSPALRIAATYPASDGRAPESIDVEIGADVNAEQLAPLVEVVVAALARVAHQRDLAPWPLPAPAIATGGPPALYDANNPDTRVHVRTDDERHSGAGTAR